MIRLGERQELVIVKQVEFGVYLAVSFEDAAEHILLPIKQVPEGSKVGDKLDVFVYRDSRDRMIATVKEPEAEAGRGCRAEGGAGWKVRRISGLGVGKGFDAAL